MVAWSINTLDEGFKNDMDDAVSIKRRLEAMKQIYDAGIRTVCFIAPCLPGITDFEAIFHQVRKSMRPDMVRKSKPARRIQKRHHGLYL